MKLCYIYSNIVERSESKCHKMIASIKKKIVKIFTTLLFVNNIVFAQVEYFVQVNPTTCSYTILDSIPIIKWIAVGTSTFDKTNRRYIFHGMDNGNHNYLCSIDATNGNTVSIPLMNSQFGCVKFDNSNGILYGIHWSTSLANGDFVSINPATLAYTVISPINLTTIGSDVTFDDINHRYIIAAGDNIGNQCLFSIDATTGNIISKPPLSGVSGIQFDNSSGNLYGLHWDNSLQTEYFVSINITNGTITIINSIPLVKSIAMGYPTFDELNKRYTFSGSDNSGNRYLFTLDATNGQVVSNPLFPVFIPPYNLIETKYDNSSGNLYALHWGPICPPTAPLASNKTICSGDSVLLSAVGIGIISWYSASIGGTYFGRGANYTTPKLTKDTIYYAQDSTCAPSSRTAVIIKVNSFPTVSVSGSMSICPGSGAVLSASGGMNYLWSNGATASSIIVSPVAFTNYSITVANGACAKDTNVIVSVYPGTGIVGISGNNSICFGDSTLLYASGVTNYLWSTGATGSSIIVKPTVNTLYEVTVTNLTCSGSSSILVSVTPMPTATITNSQTICAGSSVQLIASGGTIFLWNTGATSSSVQVNPNTTTSYSVIVSNGNCSDTANTFVIVNPLPQGIACCDTTIIPDQNVQLIINPVNSVYSYNWTPTEGLSCNTCASPMASPKVTTIYQLTITSNKGCEINDMVTVNIICGELFVPNAFSPNGDGQNDVLYVKGFCIQTFSLEIYDRWGNKVFETTDITRGWNGSYQNSGKELNTDVFVYSLQAILMDGTSIAKKGNISLIR